MKVVIAGSRIFRGEESYKILRDAMDSLGLDITEVVSGHAHGADRLGERYAAERGLPVKRFIPEWRPGGEYDPQAGFKRNVEMACYGDYLVAFDMGTAGTGHMIRAMQRLNKPVYVVRA